MPIPKPRAKEKRQDFINRCMDNEIMKEDFPKGKQRLAVCYSQLGKGMSKAKTKPKSKLEGILRS